jgi:single-stranded-DNA-specific exonuclease
MNGIAFNMSKYFDHIHAHKPFDICYTIEENKHQNASNTVQLQVKEIKIS